MQMTLFKKDIIKENNYVPHKDFVDSTTYDRVNEWIARSLPMCLGEKGIETQILILLR